jgi:hypothetical protein
MHRDRSNRLMGCVDCGTPLDVGRERAYRGHGDWVLCWACALKRGAQFDEQAEHWTRPPDVTGLPPEDDHRVR